MDDNKMTDDELDEAIKELANESAQPFGHLVNYDEERFRLLYSAFGAVDFAILLFLLNALMTDSTVTKDLHAPLYATIVGLCANSFAASLSFFRPTPYLIASAVAFFIGAVASVVAIYLLLVPLDNTAAGLFLVLSGAAVIILQIATFRSTLSTLEKRQQLLARLAQNPPKERAGE